MDLTAAISRIEPDQFWRWTRAVLGAGFAFFLALIIACTWVSPTILLAMGALLLGGLAFGLLARDEVALLCAILAGFVVVARYKEGFQPEEVLYGLIYLTYLGYWFVSRIFFYRDRILRTAIDWALLLFLVYVTLSLGLTFLLGGEIKQGLSEWLSISMLAFHFPIKEASIRFRLQKAPKRILLSLGLVAVYIAARNLLDYRSGLSQADYLWQIATGRVVMNEHVLLAAGLITMAFLLYASNSRQRLLLTLLFFLFSTGVLIGQSRAVWLSFALGMLVIFLMVDRRRRLQIAMLGFGALTVIVVAGFVFLENFFTVIVAGLTDRFFSLRSAVSADISLINRFIEMEAAWNHFIHNPIVGSGLGVPLDYHSLIYNGTHRTSFIHNGYLGALYHHGLIGSGLLFFYFFGSLATGLRVARYRGVEHQHHIVGMAVVAVLVAVALVGNSESPFATSDKTLMIGSLTGLLAAAWNDAQERQSNARA